MKKELKLIEACKNGNATEISRLLSRTVLFSKINVNKLINGVTPLFVASTEKQLEVIKTLITFGADVNISNQNGVTPLMAVSINGFVEGAKILIESGADLNSPEGKNNPICLASENGQSNIVRILLASGVDPYGSSSMLAANLAAQNGHIEIFNILSKAGIEGITNLLK